MGRVEMARCFLHNQNFFFWLSSFLWPFLDVAQKSSESIPSKNFVILGERSFLSFLASCVHKTKSISSTGFLILHGEKKAKKWNRNNKKSTSKNNNTNRRNSFTHPRFVWQLPFSGGMYMYIVIYAYFPECGKEKASRAESSTRDNIKTRTIIMLIMIIAPDTQRVKRHRNDVLHRIKAGTSGCAIVSANAKITDTTREVEASTLRTGSHA